MMRPARAILVGICHFRSIIMAKRNMLVMIKARTAGMLKPEIKQWKNNAAMAAVAVNLCLVVFSIIAGLRLKIFLPKMTIMEASKAIWRPEIAKRWATPVLIKFSVVCGDMPLRSPVSIAL